MDFPNGDVVGRRTVNVLLEGMVQLSTMKLREVNVEVGCVLMMLSGSGQ